MTIVDDRIDRYVYALVGSSESGGKRSRVRSNALG